MTTAIPSHLATYKDNSLFYTFEISTATVLKTSRWSDTYVSGSGSSSVGGYGGHISGGGSTSISSEVVQNNEVWFQIDNGGEYQYVFSGDQAGIPLREGQRVSFILCHDKQGKETVCGIINHATGMTHHLNLPVTMMSFDMFWRFMGIGLLSCLIIAPISIPVMIGALVMRSKTKKMRAKITTHVEKINAAYVPPKSASATITPNAALATA